MRFRSYFHHAGLLGLLLLICLALGSAYAGSATWNLNPATGDWNTPANWTPAIVPNGPADIATFGASNLARVSISAVTEIDSIVFEPGARPFTITNSPFHEFTISGAGIVNNSGVTQTFVAQMGSGSPLDQIESPAFPVISFTNSAAAGSNTAFLAFGANSELGVGGNVSFFDSSSADHATFDIDGSSGEAYSTSLGFFGSSTAANATIRVHRNGFLEVDGFNSVPTLANAVVTNTEGTVRMFSGGSAGEATITNIGHRQFSKVSMTVTGGPNVVTTLGNATIINEGGNPETGYGATSLSSFTGASCSAGDSVIINNGGSGGGKDGGTVSFFTGSTAENATLIANPGTDGAGGGGIIFADASLGAAARCEVFGNGSLDISQHDAPGMALGSLEGDGLVFLGGQNLTIGSNALTTTFSGRIQDGGIQPDAGGSLTKIGSATLTLNGRNTYTGSTTVNDGALVAANGTGSATGTGAVQINAGVLGGGGTITGPVIAGTGSGAGAFLVPAFGSTKQTTLTLQDSLTLQADATYSYSFKAKSNQSRSDLVIANGVTIMGAVIAISGTTQGTMTLGTTLILISNTAATPISGTFSNLADGAIVTVNGNNLQASYTGGDGNDLTLTAVP